MGTTQSQSEHKPKYVGYPNKVVASNNTITKAFELGPDEKYVDTELLGREIKSAKKAGGWIFTENHRLVRLKNFIVLHYYSLEKHHFLYYDNNLNYIKKRNYEQREYADGTYETIEDVKLVNYDNFVCRHDCDRLAIVDLRPWKLNRVREIFSDTGRWYFRVDDNNNVIVACDFDDNKSFTIRTYSSSSDYALYTKKRYPQIDCFISSTMGNVVYLPILNPAIMTYYRFSHILSVKYCKESNTYVVVRNRYFSDLVVSEWKCVDGDKWQVTDVYGTDKMEEYYKLNLLMKSNVIDMAVSGGTVGGCIVVDDYQKWLQEMCSLLIELDSLKGLSESLLMLILFYVA